MSILNNALRAAMLAAVFTTVPLSAAFAQAATTSVEIVEEQEQPPVVSTMQALIVDRDDEGNETFREAEGVNPGEVIQYNIEHLNQSGGALGGFVIQGRVPDGTIYVGDSDAGPDASQFEVLIDGEEWQGEPAYKTIINADGEEERVLATPEDYLMIRWVLAEALPDEESVIGSYRVQVQTN